MNTHRCALRSGGLAALLAFAPTAVPAAVQLPTWFVNETIVTGLDHPNSMAFLPDGRLLFTEQSSARVRMVVNGHIAAVDPVLSISGVTHGYERGLQGIAVDPAWPARPFIYIYTTHSGNRCVVARYTGQGDLANPSGENLTLTDRVELIGNIPDSDTNHNAGCLRFGGDGYLYVSVGEDYDACGAQDSTSLEGQVLRIDVDRIPATPPASVPRALIIPPGNPLSSPDSNARLVWAYGLRNPWRFHVDRPTGLLYLADVGANDFEELDEVTAGDNLGWPLREANQVVPNSECPEPGGVGAAGYRTPIATYANGSGEAVIFTAGAYRPVTGGSGNWPSSHWGDVFYGDFFRGWLKRLKKVGGVWQPAPLEAGQPSPTEWATGMIGAVDFQVGPDGSLWWLRWGNDDLEDGTGSVERMRYTGTDTTSAVLISLTYVRATPDQVRLEWYVADSGLSAGLQRRAAGGAWSEIADLVSGGTGRMVYLDRDVEPGRAYDYRLAVVEGGIERFHAETRIEVPLRLDLAVRGVRPQSGGQLIIAFSIPESAPVRLEFLDVAGRRVFERDLGTLDAGNQLLSLSNVDLASGVYLARIVQSGRSASGKAIVTR